MTIGTYSDLVSSVADWLERADLNGRIPDFIALAEARFNRELRTTKMEKRSYAQLNLSDTEPQFILLPQDYQTMKAIYLANVSGKPRLQSLDVDQLRDYRSNIGDVPGVPQFYTIFADEIELCPTPNVAITLEMIYRANLVPLSGSNANNWLILQNPDLYLYGTLLEAVPFLKEGDPRVQMWVEARKTAIDQLGGLSAEVETGLGALPARPEPKARVN